MIRISTEKESRLCYWFKRLGIGLFALVFALSCIMVFINHGGVARFSPDVREITFAHWQLEDGFREGFDRAIAEYEEIKARQGVKVKIRQVSIPVRGYQQWQRTQLIGG
ncbi:MAG: hypothetical protein PHI35_07590, partial [Victivallaceae bacterium]|nr:hypothetical protein [Victivallaceae bacterium]